jgi:hypothetical protein
MAVPGNAKLVESASRRALQSLSSLTQAPKVYNSGPSEAGASSKPGPKKK